MPHLLAHLRRDEQGVIEPWLLSFFGITLIIALGMVLALSFGIFTRGFMVRGWLENTATHTATEVIYVDEDGNFSEVNIELGHRIFNSIWARKTGGLEIPARITQVVRRGDILANGVIAKESGFIATADFIWRVQVPFIGEQIVSIPLVAFGVRQAKK